MGDVLLAVSASAREAVRWRGALVNVYDGGEGLPGTKLLFWKKRLGAAALVGYRYVWLLDSDIVVGDPAEIARTAVLVGASILQPAVLPQHRGKFRANRSRCGVEATSFVEMQAPLFEASLWTRFHAQVLSRIPDHILRDSDSGIDFLWCRFAEEWGGGCFFSHVDVVAHLDTKTLSQHKNLSQRGNASLFRYLARSWPHYIRYPSARAKRSACVRVASGPAITFVNATATATYTVGSRQAVQQTTTRAAID